MISDGIFSNVKHVHWHKMIQFYINKICVSDIVSWNKPKYYIRNAANVATKLSSINNQFS